MSLHRVWKNVSKIYYEKLPDGTGVSITECQKGVSVIDVRALDLVNEKLKESLDSEILALRNNERLRARIEKAEAMLGLLAVAVEGIQKISKDENGYEWGTITEVLKQVEGYKNAKRD